MINRVNSVFITNVAAAADGTTDINTLPVNTLFIEKENYDGSRALVTSATAIDQSVKALQIGLVTGTEVITDNAGVAKTVAIVNRANPIQRGALASTNYAAFADRVQDSIKIDLSGITVEVGHRYVLRLQRLDLTEHPGVMTYSYEKVATTTAPADIAAALAAQISKDQRPGVTATVAGAVLTITAVEKTDSEGLWPVNLYSRIRIDAYMHKTIPTVGMIVNMPIALNGVVIEKTTGNNGEGYWKVVRDRERWSLGYQGITYRENLVYPYIAPMPNVQIGGTYNTLVLNYDNKYRSPNVEYRYDAPLTIELYSKVTDGADLTAVKAIVDTFQRL